MEFKRGDVVKCVENGGDPQAYHVTIGREYVVNSVERHYGSSYLVVLADDQRGNLLLHSMFEPVSN